MPAETGSRRLRLSDRIGLAAGMPLRIDAADAGRIEHIVIDTVDVTFSDDQAAGLTLAHPLAYTHLDGALCMASVPQPAGTGNDLTRDAILGDECAFLASLTDIGASATLEISDGVSPPEYHQAQLYETLSDADGYFRLPPVARVAMVFIHAERAASARRRRPGRPRLSTGRNRITVMFP